MRRRSMSGDFWQTARLVFVIGVPSYACAPSTCYGKERAIHVKNMPCARRASTSLHLQSLHPMLPAELHLESDLTTLRPCGKFAMSALGTRPVMMLG